MTRFLLDSNVLIAATIAEHEHHDAAATWLADAEGFAVCPVVEGALVRFLMRIGESGDTASRILAAVRSHPRSQFWPDAVSYVDVALSRIRGHRQVTDAYLARLASSKGSLLATFDTTLAELWPDQTMLIPHEKTHSPDV
ncbi:PIN domain-containing protein [Georgenia yuyongxinii]|uniref:Ribonuclease VapC n=1 Tax=Georgenia yuyongxinii TaxID=2589797 RepID=A0A5B8C3W6_9MICO|nr:TA system VapC family ribonuclease toxin [Georgenia yuyongxinii]QDC24847.1 PIN domain-containing protein [Georgenia yuyongxinii]